MKIIRFNNFAEFSEHHSQNQTAWETLSAANPMLAPAWIIPWWETYGEAADRDLCWLAGFNRDELVGIAPFYIDDANSTKRLRFLGDGDVCSDHMSLLACPDNRALFVMDVCDWLGEEIGKTWKSAYFECVPAEDKNIISISDLLDESGLSIYQRPNCSSWQVDLPETWDEYLMTLSKNQRKRCRRYCRQWIDSGKLTLESVNEQNDLEEAFDKLCRLHNARRHFLGQTGAFEDQQFFEFHKEATKQLLANGQLRLDFLMDGDRPVTCEYLFTNNQSVFSYQSGYDPEYSSIGAGNISLALAIKSAIDEGFKTFDFLRGSESYKQSWKATETKTLDVHVNQKNLNGTIEQAKLGTKDWLRSLRDMVKGK